MDYLNINDIREVGQIAANCDKEKLNIAEEEAFLFDLKPQIGCYYIDLKENWNQESGKWNDIINKKEYEPNDCGCGRYCGYHLGLKKALAYYTYARYIIINEFNDTPNGNVAKTNNFSMPTDTKLLKDRADAYRDMARETIDEVIAYMRNNKSEYKRFFKGEEKAKGYGIKIKNY